MKIARFRHGDHEATGVVVGEELVDLGRAAPALPTEPVDLLAAGPEARTAAETAAAAATERLSLDEVRLLAPVPRPRTFLGIGLNYADHVAESGRDAPTSPVFFNKQVGCVVGPGDPIVVPRAEPLLDYEGELGFVIGTPCRHVPRERAHEVIAAYLVVNDVSARDWQFRSPTMTLGKSFDSHGPIGPWLVTPDEIDPHDLRLRTWVDGDLRQDGSTSDMIFDCFDQVATLSTVFTLQPGDLVSTGTPAGVGIAMDPPALLHPGSTVRIEVEGIGTLENPVVAEPDDSGFIGGETLR
jgi:2-keto-4-pentenoate hydratase/2-oxohepta-3-ene-1,7-dioic acid hydratase in catechol pathway